MDADGGSVSIHALGDLLQTLIADYSNCTTTRDGLQTVANGSIQLIQRRASVLLPAKFVSINFGSWQQAFIETNQLVPIPQPALPPPQLSLKYFVAGQVLDRDNDGYPGAGNFNYLLDGTFSEEATVLSPSEGTGLNTFVLDAHALWVSGFLRHGETDATATTFNTGSLTHDSLEQFDDRSDFVRKQSAFSGFQVYRGVNQSSGGLEVAYDGGLSASISNVPCAGGSYQLATDDHLIGGSPDTTIFTAGKIQINRGTIRFSTTSDGEALATLKVPGSPTVQTGDAVSYGGCTP